MAGLMFYAVALAYGAPIDQGSLCASQRVCPKQPRVQSDASNPVRHEARILASGHARVRTPTTREQELAGPLVGNLQIIIDGLAGLFAQFESDGLTSFPLSHGCAVRRVAAGCDILDPVATTSHPRS